MRSQIWTAVAGAVPLEVIRFGTVTDLYWASRDLILAQSFARQASPITPIIYSHPSDEELYAGIRDLPC